MRDVTLGDTEYFKFTTRAFSTGIPTTLDGTPVISVYEENNLTQITTGVTLTVDYDSVTGLNDVAVVATSGNGYETGKIYHLVITTGTVGGVSVEGEVIGEFGIDITRRAVWNALVSDYSVGGSFAKIIKNLTDIAQLDGTISDAGPLTTDFDTTLTGFGDGYFEDSMLIFTDAAANKGIGLPVTGYTSATGNFQFASPDDWPILPVNGDPFVIYAIHVHPIDQMAAFFNTDANAEPVAVPAATAPLADKLAWVFMTTRNKSTQTSSLKTILADDGSTAVATASVSNDGTTFTRGEFT